MPLKEKSNVSFPRNKRHGLMLGKERAKLEIKDVGFSSFLVKPWR